MRSSTIPLPASTGRISRTIVTAALLTALTLASLSAVVDNGFISLDDSDYITRNSMVRDGLTVHGIRTAFTSTYHASIWHPATWVSHMIDVELFGMWAGAHHAVSLALHTVNALLMFLLIRSLTGTLWRSAVVAALFAVHPLHVESVAWASERKDVLSTLFVLGTTLAYLLAVRRNTVARSAAVPLLFILALMSKAMVVTLPFVFLLLDWWPLARWAPSVRVGCRSILPPARLWLEKRLLFVICAASSVVTYLAQSSGGAVSSSDSLPLASRLSNAAVSYARYLGKTAWPRELSPFYSYPEGGLPIVEVAGAAVLLATVTVFVVRRAASRPYLPVGWFWFLGTLVPAIGFVQTGGQAMADRYTYFTLTGLFLAITWGGGDLLARAGKRPGPAAALSLAILIPLAAISRNQTELWKGDVPLFSRALRIDPDNWVALNVLGNNLLAEGRAEESVELYRRARTLHPGFFDANHNLGLALNALGRPEQALPYLQEAVGYRPDYAVANQSLGRTFLKLGRPLEALEPLQAAVRLDTGFTEARTDLAAAFAASGRTAEARETLETALLSNPEDPAVIFGLGMLNLSAGRATEANRHFSRLLKMNHGNPGLHLAIGAALQTHGLSEEALAHLAKSLEIAPGLADSHSKIGEILFAQGRLSAAIDHLRKAADLKPGDAASLNNLGAALAQAGRIDEAIPAFRRALAADAGSPDTHLNLGLALLDHGELEDAAAELLEAYALEPANPRIVPTLERLLLQRNGGELYAKAVRRHPRPKGLPAIPRKRGGAGASKPPIRGDRGGNNVPNPPSVARNFTQHFGES